eukprot:GDKH01010575.1.p1 GENE.GDKH01010575.1~~GDKH01010575.1.p1  ORF type:complete len:415 (+),score=114.79 GDKH01010575.1:266-1510(+)
MRPEYVISAVFAVACVAGLVFHSSLRSPPAAVNTVKYAISRQSEIGRAEAHELDSSPSGGIPIEDYYALQFARFVSFYDRAYSDDSEMEKRYNIFKSNLNTINEVNAQKLSYTLGVNEFADLTDEEWENMLMKPTGSNGLDEDSMPPSFEVFDPTEHSRMLEIHRQLEATNERGMKSSNDDSSELPTSLDWRKTGCIQEVKDQLLCGSCWAFSTTGTLEAAVCAAGLRKGKAAVVPNLSEQMLMDCSTGEINHSCHGGLPPVAMEYVRENGICAEEDYPYEGADTKIGCRSAKCTQKYDIKGVYQLKGTEAAMLQGLAFTPISVGIFASDINFKLYKEGVLVAPRCAGKDANHAVVVVGFGEENGKPYYLLRNSWGTRWGEGGYGKLYREPVTDPEASKGHCAIHELATFALIE